jgi:hypothetical protein
MLQSFKGFCPGGLTLSNGYVFIYPSLSYDIEFRQTGEMDEHQTQKLRFWKVPSTCGKDFK